MIDQSGIQIRDDLRRSLAEQMAQFEALNGEIQTQPIRTHIDKKLPFSISKADSRVIRELDKKRVEADTAKKRNSAKKIETLRKMAPKNPTLSQMCDATGLTANTVIRYLREHKIEVIRDEAPTFKYS